MKTYSAHRVFDAVTLYDPRFRNFLDDQKETMRTEIMRSIHREFGPQPVTIRWQEFSGSPAWGDPRLPGIEVTLQAQVESVESMRVVVPEHEYFLPLPEPTRHRCHYCGGLTVNDVLGNCAACGGERRGMERIEHFNEAVRYGMLALANAPTAMTRAIENQVRKYGVRYDTGAGSVVELRPDESAGFISGDVQWYRISSDWNWRA